MLATTALVFAFEPVTYISSNGSSRFTLISDKEIEFTSNGSTYLGQYGIQQNKSIRATIPILGSVQVMYLEPAGAYFQHDGKTYLPEATFLAIRRQEEQNREMAAAAEQKVKDDAATLYEESLKNRKRFMTFQNVDGTQKWEVYDAMLVVTTPNEKPRQIWYGRIENIGYMFDSHTLTIDGYRVHFNTIEAKRAAATQIDSAILAWRAKFSDMRYEVSKGLTRGIPRYSEIPKKPDIEGLWVQKVQVGNEVRELGRFRVVRLNGEFTMTSATPNPAVRIFEIVLDDENWFFKSDWGDAGIAEFKLKKRSQVEYEGFSFLQGHRRDHNKWFRIEP